MLLSRILVEVPQTTVDGAIDIDITNVAYDSRKVAPGGLFVAIKGQHVDGHRYIAQAVERGTVAIVYDDPSAISSQAPGQESTTFIRVPNSRSALSPIAAAFYGFPGREMRVVGVTGSKGKTTTSTLIAHVLDQQDHTSGLMTTVDFKIGPRWIENTTRQTTPEALEIQQMLREMADSGCDFAVVEASSHGLSAQWNRVGDCDFDVAVITNITHEHLDYHGTFEQYRRDKARLFELLGENGPHPGASRHPSPTVVGRGDEDTLHPTAVGRGDEGALQPSPSAAGGRRDDGGLNPFPAAAGEEWLPQATGVRANNRRKTAIINLDDPNAQFFIDAAGTADVITYALDNPAAMVRAIDVDLHRDGVRYTAVTPWGNVAIELGIPGEFNVLNSLAAVCVGLSEGISGEAIAAALRDVGGVTGRMERVEQGQPFTVVVDYAHNPDSFEQVMGMMRRLTDGKLISVFGSAGERDHEKRAIQGEISGRYCDLTIIADEDPRDEDREAILEQIAAGVRQTGRREGDGYLKIADRAAAIREAFARAQPGDVVLLLGKGHESCIIYENGRKLPWNERSEAEKALADMGYRTA